ncbi:phosphatidylethanolamine:Kdo2-lipid A phosphoethanolamine transferase [Paucimonas lemoignei]|uniref:Phosphatidylethanolamine:Kdo2-lipid A phosphoethanolamine transferase n=1 Tax=Paucimonas lemoignei TaxID=29443 RepID=A0A4R3HX87_PAULE|nr:phosphoethanolamine--lipid A transferase [Paucimonas lemoignei]TCS37916.1 phosphatidylethanolamine:Kdo2-lipid A phosphoethanolamine transferase [Paucimonas lemoignei]
MLFSLTSVLHAVKSLPSRYPDISFSSVAACVLALLCNWQFWRSATNAMPATSMSSTAFFPALFLLIFWVHASLLLLMPGRVAMRSVAVALIAIAATCAYFVDSFGIVIDRDMVRNVVQTDATEALGLFNVRLAGYVLLLGVFPAWFLWRMPLTQVSPRCHITQRFVFIVGGAILITAAMLPNTGRFAALVREHKPLRYLINPGNLMYASWRYLRHEAVSQSAQLVDVDGAVSRLSDIAGGKPLLVLLVVGETARAADFQLLGHSRATNPRLGAVENLYRFNQVTSCGTATAISLPCMFSGLERDGFDVTRAASRTNLLDALVKAGVDVEWRDNNSGCKGICARVPTINMNPAMAPKLCSEDYCYDEILLEGLTASVASRSGDQFVVLHQIGSHGPAYWRRYPAAFEQFKPTCRTSNLGACSLEEIHNTYDNTILYTDYVLSRAIGFLQDLSGQYDTALLYVSDHGESLGEKGVFLHGAPYLLAPDNQTRVPMILWMSDGFHRRNAIEPSCIRTLQDRPLSHDNVYHTVLGTMGVKNALYNPARDIIATCRQSKIGS